MSYTVEKDWESHGLRCVAILIEGRHRCGYVGVPIGHPLHGCLYSMHCDALDARLEVAMNGPVGKRGIIPIICSDGRKASPDIVFDVHGGITFADDLADYPVASDGLWWFGFDCAHAGDGSLSHPYGDDPVRSTEYVVSECESLARQIAEVTAAREGEMSDLLPCPFCGSETLTLTLIGSNLKNQQLYVVDCKRCDASGPIGAAKSFARAQTAARRKWNRRAK